MKNQTKSYFFGIITVLMWSTVASAFKIALKELDYLQLLFISSLVSMIFFFLVLIFQKKLNLAIFERKSLLKSLFLGILNPVVYYLVLFKSYSLLPAQIAQPINYTWVIVVSILSVIVLKQKIKKIDFICLFMGLIGVSIIASGGNLTSFSKFNLFGVFLGLSSSLFWGFFWVFNVKDERDGVVKLFLNFMIGTVLTFILVFLFSNFNFTSRGLLAATYVGLFEMGVTFLSWMLALKYAENTAKIGNLIYLSPFLSLLLINLILSEKILLSTFIGLTVILIAVILQKLFHKELKPEVV